MMEVSRTTEHAVREVLLGTIRGTTGTSERFRQATRANLLFIEDRVGGDHEGAEVYEVTQLLNSLLSLVVAADEWLVVEEWVSLEMLRQGGFPALRFSGNNPRSDLRSLMHFIRNAVSHVNVDITSDRGQITAVRLWNHLNGRLKEPHTADLVEELRQLAGLLPMRCGLLEPTTTILELRADRLEADRSDANQSRRCFQAASRSSRW
jgi:hypothetical protein